MLRILSKGFTSVSDHSPIIFEEQPFISVVTVGRRYSHIEQFKFVASEVSERGLGNLSEVGDSVHKIIYLCLKLCEQGKY